MFCYYSTDSVRLPYWVSSGHFCQVYLAGANCFSHTSLALLHDMHFLRPRSHIQHLCKCYRYYDH